LKLKNYIFLLILLPLTLSADKFAFSFYNDVFVGTDKYFTNGISLSWIDDLNLTSKDLNKYNVGVSISQIAITPSDKNISTPQYNDIPYAGYLSLDFFIFESNTKNFKEFRIGVGVVGKESGAEFIQRFSHKVIGVIDPKGWDTQLGTEYIINILLRYGEKSWERSSLNRLDMDWFNHYGTEVGNFSTNIFAGTMFRVGDNYIKNFNIHYPYLREEASLLDICKKQTDFGWSLSVGINGELLAYSYILDEAKKDGYETDKSIVSISVYTGVDLYYKRHKTTIFYQSQSPYTKQQDKMNSFGGFLYSFQF